jgi:hypothetical protein
MPVSSRMITLGYQLSTGNYTAVIYFGQLTGRLRFLYASAARLTRSAAPTSPRNPAPTSVT